jgi:DNA-binding HxlR family transcriptional regulator
MYKFDNKEYKCSLEAVIDLLGGKWRSLIIWHLNKEKLRFSEVQRIVPGISKKVLSEHLRYLEKNEMIIRTVYPTVPPQVEYKLTEKAKKLAEILDLLDQYSKNELLK